MWKAVGHWILDLLYPPKCAFCHTLLKKGMVGICPTCENTLPKLSKSQGVQKKKGAGTCYSPLRYHGEVRASVHRYKFGNCSGYGAVYAPLVCQYLQEHCQELPQVVTWVPLSKKSLKKRGYDQAYLLAWEIAKGLNLPLESTLVKVRHTKQQSTLAKEERSANVLDAYQTLPKWNGEGKTYLLVDDVVTSGSTLSECTYQLRMAGANQVVCATLASAI